MSVIQKYFLPTTLTWICLPLICLNSFIWAMFINMAIFLSKIFHFNVLQVGQVLSLFYFGNWLGSLLSALISLKYSCFRMMIFCSFMLGILLIVLSNLHEIFSIQVVIFLIGVLMSLFSVSTLALFVSTSSFADEKLKLINLDLIIYNLCFSISTYIVFKLNAAEIFYLFHMLGFSLLFLSMVYCCSRHALNWPGLSQTNASISFRGVKFNVLSLILFTVFFVGLIFSMIKVIYLPTLANRFSYYGTASFVASINPWLIFLVQPFLINNLKHKNKLLMMGVGILTVGLGYYSFGISSAFIGTVGSLLLMTFGEILFAPLSKASIIAIFHEGFESLALSLWKFIFLSGSFIGPIFAGWIIHAFNERLVWELCGLIGVLGFVLLFFGGVSRYRLE